MIAQMLEEMAHMAHVQRQDAEAEYKTQKRVLVREIRNLRATVAALQVRWQSPSRVGCRSLTRRHRPCACLYLSRRSVCTPKLRGRGSNSGLLCLQLSNTNVHCLLFVGCGVGLGYALAPVRKNCLPEPTSCE